MTSMILPPLPNFIDRLSSFPTLADHQLHIWRMKTDVSHQQPPPLLDRLTDLERQRATQQHGNANGQFIHSRGGLRALLALYLGREARSIELSYGVNGKPQLKDSALQFNVSHAQNTIVYAFCMRSTIGIDLESLTREIRWTALSKRFFSTTEQQLIEQLPTDKRKAGFLLMWTAKEAYIKMNGASLLRSLAMCTLDTESILAQRKYQFLTANNAYPVTHFSAFGDDISAVVHSGIVDSVKYFDIRSILSL